MKTKKFLWILLLAIATVAVPFSFTSCDNNDPEIIDPDPNPNPNPDPDPDPDPDVELPDSIKNGSDFYCIYLDALSTAALGNKVKVPTMMRDYDVWPAGESLLGAERLGINAFGFPEGWIAFDQAEWAQAWNGGAIIAVLEQFENIPDLSAIDGSYTFHFAIKSPTNQTNAGWTIFLYSEGPDLKYYFGPKASAPADQVYGGNYTHDGEWHHFEIPVSQLLASGYLWTGPLHMTPVEGQSRRYLLGFQGGPHMPGIELNLDAIFFYKKPAK